MGVNSTYLVSARLEHGGTTFGSAFPHGGTSLGVCSRIAVTPVNYMERIHREEDNATDEVLLFGSDLVVSFRLMEWSADGLNALFPSTRLSGSDRIITWPYAAQAAPSLTPLVFSPRNPDHPALILFNAEVVAAREVRSRLTATGHVSWDFLVYGTPNGSGNVGEMGKLSLLNTS